MWDLVPWGGIEPGPPGLGVWSLSHWTTREAPPYKLKLSQLYVIATSIRSQPRLPPSGVALVTVISTPSEPMPGLVLDSFLFFDHFFQRPSTDSISYWFCCTFISSKFSSTAGVPPPRLSTWFYTHRPNPFPICWLGPSYAVVRAAQIWSPDCPTSALPKSVLSLWKSLNCPITGVFTASFSRFVSCLCSGPQMTPSVSPEWFLVPQMQPLFPTLRPLHGLAFLSGMVSSLLWLTHVYIQSMCPCAGSWLEAWGHERDLVPFPVGSGTSSGGQG